MRRLLATAIAVMDEPVLGLPATHGHLQGVQHQRRAHMDRHRPAHQLPVVEIELRRQIEPPSSVQFAVISATQTRFGAATVNWRFSKLDATGRVC